MPSETEYASVVPYLKALWRRRWLIVIVTGVFVVVALAYGIETKKQYTATSDLLLEAPLPTALLVANGSGAYQSPTNVADAEEVIESGAVADLVRAEIGSAPRVSVAPVNTQSDVVAISATSSKAALAQRAANAYAQMYVSYMNQRTAASLDRASGVVQTELAAVEADIAQYGAEVTATGSSTADAGARAAAATAQAALQSEETTLENELVTYQTLASNQSNESGAVITSAPLPTSPSSPKRTEYAVFALLAGIVVSVLIALALQYREESAASRGGQASRDGVPWRTPGPDEDTAEMYPPVRVGSHSASEDVQPVPVS